MNRQLLTNLRRWDSILNVTNHALAFCSGVKSVGNDDCSSRLSLVRSTKVTNYLKPHE